MFVYWQSSLLPELWVLHIQCLCFSPLSVWDLFPVCWRPFCVKYTTWTLPKSTLPCKYCKGSQVWLNSALTSQKTPLILKKNCLRDSNFQRSQFCHHFFYYLCLCFLTVWLVCQQTEHCNFDSNDTNRRRNCYRIHRNFSDKTPQNQTFCVTIILEAHVICNLLTLSSQSSTAMHSQYTKNATPRCKQADNWLKLGIGIWEYKNRFYAISSHVRMFDPWW